VTALGSSLGPSYKSLSPAAQKKRLIKEHLYLRWRVQPSDVLPLREPVPIPASVYSGRNYHIATPTDISHTLFERLLVLGKKNIPELLSDDPDADEFPEGRIVERTHRRHERNTKLVKAAKAAFLKKHKRYFCQVCEFDFGKRYGRIESDYIEATIRSPSAR
jgi:hypothetical protein